MAFTQETFAPVSAQGNSDSPNMWTYRTDDLIADVKAAGYFAVKYAILNDGDFIHVRSSDEAVMGAFMAMGDDLVIVQLAPETSPAGMPLAPMNQYSVAIGDQWVNSAQISGAPVYSFTEVAIATPGQIQLDNTDLSQVTEITVSKDALNGADVSSLFEKLYEGDVVSVSDFLDSTNQLIANVTGDPIDSGLSYKIPVSVQDSNGSLTSGELTSFVIQPTATRAPNIVIDRLYDGESGLLVQEPPAVNTAQYIQFGPVQGTVSDPIQTLAQGGDSEASILRFNQAGTYRLKTAIQYGRLTNPGVAILNFRALVNGVQAGRSINQRLNNSNVTTIFTDEAWLTLPAGIEITYEVIRDANGTNSGGLIAGEVGGSTGWNGAPSASLRVERWR